MKAAVRIDNVSKLYRIGASQGGPYRTLRESLVEAAGAPVRALRRLIRGHSPRPSKSVPDFWALKNVSFEVQPGETVGIIGRNGAGKSTLLKIISRITEPTKGRIQFRGRVGSLLEVGTGFHAELTGRENIFLNGGILGMSRREIGRKFDEIVAFAEIEKFLDTAVKHYSSGMYVRLAFAVAAHLEPEILIVDEVLAVGDVEFQRKCLDKMKDIGREGRSILFVSHNLSALQSLCRRGVVLRQGRLDYIGAIDDAVASYLRELEAAAATDISERSDRIGTGQVRLARVECSSEDLDPCSHVLLGRPGHFKFHLSGSVPGLTCNFTIFDSNGLSLARFNSGLNASTHRNSGGANPTITCTVDEMLLAPGRYRLDVSLLAHGELLDRVESAAFFDVVRGLVRGQESPRMEGGWRFYLPHRWILSDGKGKEFTPL